MKIGIIGAGFTGLSATYYLQKKGHEVVLFEKDKNPGGLAIGYKEKEWNWTLEEHYHHWFTNDKSVLNLAHEINHQVLTKRPKTSSLVDNEIYQLDSPISLLKFPKISLFDRIRMGISLGFLRFNPFWKPLEKFKAEPYLEKAMGKKGYKKVWEPLMVNKLGKYARDVSLAWFWARVFKRTSSLAYPQGGFLQFAKHLEEIIKKNNGKFYYETEVLEINSSEKTEVKFKTPKNSKIQTETFDAIIVTVPFFIFSKITPSLPREYIEKYSHLQGIGAVNMILRLKENFLPDNTYWLNMCDVNSPILAIVEHTNFMNRKNYNNEHILYVGNYMENTDPRFKMSDQELLKLYDPYLSKINPNYKKTILSFKVFRAPFAQPIVPTHYSKKIPPFKTPLKNIYLANIQQVYPWDRGTNYAVELGKKIAEIINENN
jgi:protoporphyrinogen oxidase